jgi:hypothetical protein
MKPIKTAEEILKQYTDWPDRYMNKPLVTNTFLITPKEALEAMQAYHDQFDVTDEEIVDYLSRAKVIFPERSSLFDIYELGFKQAIQMMRGRLNKKI